MFGIDDAIIGAGIVAGASMINQHSANKNASKNANSANAFTKEQWLNKHQWEVQDLKAAGLNPILSAHNGGGPAGSAMASTQMADIGSAINSGASAGRMASLLSSEKAKIKQDTATGSQTEKTLASQQKLNDATVRNNTALATSQVTKNLAEAKWMATQTNARSPWGEIGKDIADIIRFGRDALSDTPTEVAQKVGKSVAKRGADSQAYSAKDRSTYGYSDY